MSTIKLVVLAVFIALVVFYVVVKEDVLRLYPVEDKDADDNRKTGKASYYGEGYRGKRMANGGRFDPDALTCASFSYPLGVLLEVEHEGKAVVVEVTDRGPALPLGRIVDLSQAAFARIADLRRGVVIVRVRVVGRKEEGKS
jgi:rare lipoprotein A